MLLSMTAQVWRPPADTSVALPGRFVTETAVLLPLRSTASVPSWPSSLLPQHWISPLPRSAQVWRHPTDRETTWPLIPDTSTGKLRSTSVPSPTWPYLLSPQHWTLPLPINAQDASPPAAIADAPVNPLTLTGT